MYLFFFNAFFKLWQPAIFETFDSRKDYLYTSFENHKNEKEDSIFKNVGKGRKYMADPVKFYFVSITTKNYYNGKMSTIL